MKKTTGFTLIELLIVMVIISTLVTVALPKYQRALERGRALEGLRNVQYAADYANAKHMATGEYPTSLPNTDQIKNRFFDAPVINGTTVTISRKGTSWSYQLTASSSGEGYITSITCGSKSGQSTNNCEELDLTGNLMQRI